MVGNADLGCGNQASVCLQPQASCVAPGKWHQIPQTTAPQTATEGIPVLVTGCGHGVPVLPLKTGGF